MTQFIEQVLMGIAERNGGRQPKFEYLVASQGMSEEEAKACIREFRAKHYKTIKELRLASQSPYTKQQEVVESPSSTMSDGSYSQDQTSITGGSTQELSSMTSSGTPSQELSSKESTTTTQSSQKKKFHLDIHKILNREAIQILFSLVAIVDLVRHYINYYDFFIRSQDQFVASTTSILNSVPLVILPAAIIFAWKARKWVGSIVMSLTFLSCVFFSVYVTYENLAFHDANMLKVANQSVKTDVNGKQKIENLKEQNVKILSDNEALKAQNEEVRPKLAGDPSSSEYKSAIRLINTNERKIDSNTATYNSNITSINLLLETVDTSAELVKKNDFTNTMNVVQGIFLDLIGISAVYAAFFL